MTSPDAAITVRQATPADYAAIGALLAEAFGGTDRRRARLRDNVARRARRARIFVAVDGRGVVLGTATYVEPGRLRRNPLTQLARHGEADLRHVAVTAAARNRGVARRLIEACIAHARACGRARLLSVSDPGNVAVHRANLAAGMKRIPARDWTNRDGRTLLTWGIELDGR